MQFYVKQEQIMLIDLRRSFYLVLKESNPEESLDTRQDKSTTCPDFPFKTFFRVGSLGSNFEESLDTDQDKSTTCPDFPFKTFFGVGSHVRKMEVNGIGKKLFYR